MRKPGPPRDIPPPLEMLCLKALWSRGEGNVNDVREAVAESKALAYTTVMTLLERLAKKNVVSRRKVGRAFVYSPAISRDAMRRLALKEFLDCYFDGSEQKLGAFLLRQEPLPPSREIEPETGMDAALL
jgi:BlaI family penicillinase repressor